MTCFSGDCEKTPFLPSLLEGHPSACSQSLLSGCRADGISHQVEPEPLFSVTNRGGPGGVNGHSVVGGGTHLVGTPGTPVPSGSRVNGFLTPTTPAATSGTPLRSHASAADKPGGPPIKGKNKASKLTCTTLGNFLCTCLHLLNFQGCSQPLVVVWTDGAD